jgi:hypothetical protein
MADTEHDAPKRCRRILKKGHRTGSSKRTRAGL